MDLEYPKESHIVIIMLLIYVRIYRENKETYQTIILKLTIDSYFNVGYVGGIKYR